MNKAAPETGESVGHDIGTCVDDDDGLIITCEDAAEPVVRKTFRVPMDEGVVSCEVQGKSYSVADLSMYGVGLRVFDPEDFRIGEVIPRGRIEFSDQAFLVDVQVIHVSPRDGDQLVCGLHIVHTHDAGYVDWMTRVIAEMKAAMLTPKDVFK